MSAPTASSMCPAQSPEVTTTKESTLPLGVSSGPQGYCTGLPEATNTKMTGELSSESTGPQFDFPEQQACEAFTLFPKLAPELRYRVWYWALPRGRVVDIDTYKSSINGDEDKRMHVESDNKKFPLPITLRICKESRTETLRHYHVLPRVGFQKFKSVPFSIDPVADRCLLNFMIAVNLTSTLTWEEECWIAQLANGSSSACLAKIEELNIFQFNNFEKAKDLALHIHAAHGHQVHVHNQPYCCMFRFFPALKKVNLYLIQRGEEGLEAPEKKQELKRFFTVLLDTHKQVFPGGKIPVVSLMP
ncbi:uncharacterized protein L3040_001242 [Drepanopeziza brunnea f. sp. 'multigermtubi']|uniref:uncharacterized protein n=1 Tax=Drepanopeziza brunnea f. sp. 'multigermtubi' TaxID=698441 RepID=UPI00239BDA83|nr:hypothetical protein L3040_001242 [Drepanopeziza brunnea f. sp. 'multigermtubi']